MCERKWVFSEIKIWNLTALDLIKCLKKFKDQRLLLKCAPISELPPNISTMINSRSYLRIGLLDVENTNHCKQRLKNGAYIDSFGSAYKKNVSFIAFYPFPLVFQHSLITCWKTFLISLYLALYVYSNNSLLLCRSVRLSIWLRRWGGGGRAGAGSRSRRRHLRQSSCLCPRINK